MNLVRQRLSADLLGVIAMLSIPAFVAILCFVAARDPAEQPLLGVVITGLGAGGLIVFRQLRKAARSLMASQARAEYAATHDGKTQLPNKALFLDRLTDAAQAVLKDAATPGVFCIGLDRFSETNEILGIGATDAVVVELAERLAAACQPTDTLARVGDDCFALLTGQSSRVRAELLAAQLMQRLAPPCVASAGQAHMTFSVGVGFVTTDLEHPAEALRQAQLAMSSARRLGGGRFAVFEPGMDQALKARSLLELDLRQALASGELTLVYQPQVDAKGAIHGVEALMRWISPTRGEISPTVFVPLAESCGLSDELGALALRQALADCVRWPDLRVAVNVSAQQVRSGRLIPTLKDLLSRSEVAARSIELEITEGVLLSDEPETFDTLHALRRLGFSLALDDFGTGYSSLSYLRRFPVDKIKIDRSFVSHLGKRPESTAIIKAIVDLAQALELKVIAEGVESRDQVDRLTAAGCHHFQGYFFSPPVAAEAIDGMVAGRSKLAA